MNTPSANVTPNSPQEQPKAAPLLSVQNLRTHFNTPSGVARAVDGVSFDIPRGKTFAIVGESGCGKSVTALSIMRLLPRPAGFIPEGRIILDGVDLLKLPETEMRRVRGDRIAMIFQEPQTSLNPVMRVGRQIDEALIFHQGLSSREAREAGIAMLRKVRMPDPERQHRAYPHELSGGMKQRVMIAMALACRPALLIADEPTTSLDVTVEQQILALMKDLQAEYGMSILLITHNLGVVAETADEVGVMYAGHLVERAGVRGALKDPQHPYTQRLLESIPSRLKRGGDLQAIPGLVPPATAYGPGCRFAPRCHREMACCAATLPKPYAVGAGHTAACLLHDPQLRASPKVDKPDTRLASPRTAAPLSRVAAAADQAPLLAVKGLTVHFPIRRGVLQRTDGWVRAVDGVDLGIPRGKTVALVGESGCGKTTAGKGILQLVRPTAGEVRYEDRDLAALSDSEMRPLRRDLQIIFQDPYSSLDPRLMVSEIVGEGLRAQHITRGRDETEDRVRALLKTVQLDEDMIHRYPHEFSGGQRQRIGIARALAVNPKFIVCDEVTSALDVSVQAQILNLLGDLQDRLGLSYLFITHDLSVVGYLADIVAVMYLGRIVEIGLAEEIFSEAKHPYTQALFSAAPSTDPDARRKHIVLEGDVPSPSAPPEGCHFNPRCPFAMAVCKVQFPGVSAFSGTHEAKCHLYGEGKQKEKP
jgi:peptide/nickel transport system ATP-binding protein